MSIEQYYNVRLPQLCLSLYPTKNSCWLLLLCLHHSDYSYSYAHKFIQFVGLSKTAQQQLWYCTSTSFFQIIIQTTSLCTPVHSSHIKKKCANYICSENLEIILEKKYLRFVCVTETFKLFLDLSLYKYFFLLLVTRTNFSRLFFYLTTEVFCFCYIYGLHYIFLPYKNM